MPVNHTVAQGDCLSNIADRFGFLPQTLWSLPDNADLKRTRQDPNVLFPGDVVFVPDKRLRVEARGTDQQHVFKRKGVPAKMRVRLTDDGQPRANVAYQLEIDGVWSTGFSSADGLIEHGIPPGAKRGKLLIGSGTTKDIHEFAFGTVDPISTESGVRGRLKDLGYGGDENLREAVMAFQMKEELEATGEIDAGTRNRLQEKFGQ
jgi:hypothetical protein